VVPWNILNSVQTPVLNGRGSHHEQDLLHSAPDLSSVEAGPDPEEVDWGEDFRPLEPGEIAEVLGSLKEGALKGKGGKDEETYLIELVLGPRGGKTFMDDHGRPFISFILGGKPLLHQIEDEGFQVWLRSQAKESGRKFPSDTTIKNVVAYLKHNAQESGQVEHVYYRVAPWLDPTTQENKILLDLGTPDQKYVEIGPKDWEIKGGTCPVHFHRQGGMRPLPTPKRDGSLRELQKLLNLKEEANFKKVVGWLLAALNPGIPYPVLVISGPEGSAKSTMARELRNLVDPHSTPVVGPQKEENLILLAKTSWVVALDNLSYIPPGLSDLLCRLATGSGDIQRKFYIQNVALFSYVRRPLLLNGIPGEMVSRSDLLSRSLMVRLEPIKDTETRLESEVISSMEAARPRLLGALLTAVSAGLRNQATTKLARMPRMADLAQWVESCVPVLPNWNREEFTNLLMRDREDQDAIILNDWPVFRYLKMILKDGGEFEDTVGGWLQDLDALRQEKSKGPRPYGWPMSPRGLGTQLDRYHLALSRVNIMVNKSHRGKRGYVVNISYRKNPDHETPEGEGGECSQTGCSPPSSTPNL
jgi:hypothetical protein